MADITVPIGGKSDFKLLFKDQGSGIYAPAVSLIGGGGGGSTTFAGLTDRVPFTNPIAGSPAMQVKAATLQTSELWDFLDPSGTARVTVGSLKTLSDSTLIVGSVPSQTGPALNVQDSGGATVLQIEPSGRISTPGTVDLSIRAGTGGNLFLGSGTTDVIDVQGSQILLLQAVRASAANAIGLVVRGATSQTSDLQTWNEGTTNVVLAGINAVGGLRLAGSDTNTKLLVAPFGTATVAANDALIQCNADACTALIVKRFSATQSANLTEWQDETGALMSGVGPNGRFGIGTAPVSTQRLTVATSTTTHKGLVVKMVAAATGSAQEWQDSGGVARVIVGDLTQVASLTLALRGITSQTGMLLQFQDSAGAALSGVNTLGQIVASNGTNAFATSTGNQVAQMQNGAAVFSKSTSTVALIAKAIASQTGSLFEAQDSGAVARVLIGSLTATGDHTLVVRAITSQTGNLQRWLDAAGTTVVAAMPIDGQFQATSISTVNSLIRMREQNSGGKLLLSKASGAASVPGADKTESYLRDGTLAGTLKLVVRAGTAGDETTLFDNIGQAAGGGITLGTLRLIDATTAVITNGLVIGHNTSGTAAAGFGNQAQFQLQSSTTADRAVGELSYEWVVATDASRTARGKWTVYDTAVREAIRVEASGSAAMIGFLGSAAVVRQAGASAAGIAAITDASAKAAITALQNALAAYGLVTAPA